MLVELWNRAINPSQQHIWQVICFYSVNRTLLMWLIKLKLNQSESCVSLFLLQTEYVSGLGADM